MTNSKTKLEKALKDFIDEAILYGIEQEQERIIKLLNDLPTQVDYKDGMTESVSYSPDYLIELIKGETK